MEVTEMAAQYNDLQKPLDITKKPAGRPDALH